MLVTLVMLVTPVAAATLTVDPAGSSTYATIQDAIDAASTLGERMQVEQD